MDSFNPLRTVHHPALPALALGIPKMSDSTYQPPGPPAMHGVLGGVFDPLGQESII